MAKNTTPEKPARYFVIRPFLWNRRNPNTDALENLPVAKGTCVDFLPSVAAMLVSAKKIEEYDEKNEKHKPAEKAAPKPAPHPVKT